MSSRVLITGAAGQLGYELGVTFGAGHEVVVFDRSSLDLASEEQIRAAVRDAKPEIILNAAAYTAVDRAESERGPAFAINARAPEVLAEEAARCGALLVHYSTDYVFDGAKHGAWVEEDATHPINVYGASKLAGEEAIRKVGGRFLIFRTSWVYAPRGKNFLLTMLRLAGERDALSVVSDQVGAPTTAAALAAATLAVVDGIDAGKFDAAGVYHMTCAGETSWHGFAEAIFTQAAALGLLKKPKPEVKAIPSSEFPTPAKRPANSVLLNAKLREVFGVQLPAWQDALDVVLRQLRGAV